MAGMDKAEALAFVSRMFDAASAGSAIWEIRFWSSGFCLSAAVQAVKKRFAAIGAKYVTSCDGVTCTIRIYFRLKGVGDQQGSGLRANEACLDADQGRCR